MSAYALPPTGQVFVSDYVAIPVGNKQLMVTWCSDDGTLNEVFVMNFQAGVVSDVAPVPIHQRRDRADRGAGATRIPPP